MGNLYFEDLADRRLWIDSESSLSTNNVLDKILSDEEIDGTIIHEKDFDIDKLLKLTDKKFKIKSNPDFNVIDDRFVLPEHYRSIDLEKHFIKSAINRGNLKAKKDQEKEVIVERIYQELRLYEEKGLIDVLRLAIYIVDVFVDKGVVWGPGRGSSCCSYLLYLIGLHDIDSIEFDLDIFEFLRDD